MPTLTTFLSSGRVERLAGVILVLVIVTSAALARREVVPSAEVSRTLDQAILGLIRPGDVSAIRPPTEVTIVEVLVDVGDELVAGQPIARLDFGEEQRDLALFGMDVERVSRDVAYREQDVMRIRESIARLREEGSDPASRLALVEREAQEIPVRQLKDSPERAMVALEQAFLRTHRVEQLAEAGLASRQEVDEARAAYRLAGDDLANAQRSSEMAARLRVAQDAQARALYSASLASLRGQMAEHEAGLEQARLTLKQMEMRHQAARAVSADPFVRTPRAGAIIELAVLAGDRLAPGALVATVASLDPLTVDLDVPPLVVNSLRVGDPALVDVPAIGVSGQDARIRVIAPLPGENGKYLVQLSLSNPTHARLVGQTAEATLTQSNQPATE